MTPQTPPARHPVPGTPHPARVYDYWLGGGNHHAEDAEAGERVARVWPGVRTGARLNRAFLQRATHWLAAEAGIRQFLDIGSGIPVAPHLHEVAGAAAPGSRVVYVDHDPVVLEHARDLLPGLPDGRTAFVQGDFREPGRLLELPELRRTLDLEQPVALCLVALLHLVPDRAGAYENVRHLMDALPSGSYLMLSHATADFDPDLFTRVTETYQSRVAEGQLRAGTEIQRFFDGLEPVEPGLVAAHRWRPDPAEEQPDVTDAELSVYAGLARKP